MQRNNSTLWGATKSFSVSTVLAILGLSFVAFSSVPYITVVLTDNFDDIGHPYLRFLLGNVLLNSLT